MSNRKFHLFLATCKQSDTAKAEFDCGKECKDRSKQFYSGTCDGGNCTCLRKFLQSHSYSYANLKKKLRFSIYFWGTEVKETTKKYLINSKVNKYSLLYYRYHSKLCIKNSNIYGNFFQISNLTAVNAFDVIFVLFIRFYLFLKSIKISCIFRLFL